MLFSCLSSTTLVSIVLLFTSANLVHGWGFDGHALIASIAQTLLTEDASTFVRHHLPADVHGNMSKVASWADTILYPDTDPDYWNWQWSKELHYVNIEDWSCTYNQQADCDWTDGKRCVDGAIQNYTERLADSEQDRIQRQEALKFLIHFIGDVHQPLHGGFAGDRGGNSIRGSFFGKQVNLHSLWDTTMIKRRMDQDFQSEPILYLDYLIKQLKTVYGRNVSQWTDCSSSSESSFLACAKLWIDEDAILDCEVVYRDEDDQKITISTGFNLGQTYYNTRIITVELRLIQAGVRLAAVINKIVQSIGKEEEPDDTCSTTILILSVLILQFTVILLLLMYSILRRKTTIVIQPSIYDEKTPHMVTV